MAPFFGACVAVFSLHLHKPEAKVELRDMDRKARSLSPSFFSLAMGLCGLSLALSLSACDGQDLPWSPEPAHDTDSSSASSGPPSETTFPGGDKPGAGKGASAGTSQGSTQDCQGGNGQVPDDPSDPGPGAKGSGEASGGGTSPEEGKQGEPGNSLNLELWELLYNPSGSDGLAASPEVLELLVNGPANHKGKLLFELQGQGWSQLSASDFEGSELGPMRVGSILRIERYKNQKELDKANQQFPLRQIMDPKSGELAVQILRRTGSGLRNKGGWLKIRSGSSEHTQGVIYGEIPRAQVDEELAAMWQGPFANPAPSGQALCQIPDSSSVEKHSAAWWTACEASQWGRDKESTESNN